MDILVRMHIPLRPLKCGGGNNFAAIPFPRNKPANIRFTQVIYLLELREEQFVQRQLSIDAPVGSLDWTRIYIVVSARNINNTYVYSVVKAI